MSVKQVVVVSPIPKSFIGDYALGVVDIALSYEFPFSVSRLHVVARSPLLVDFGEVGYAKEGCIEVDEACSRCHRFTLNAAYTPMTNHEEIESLLTIDTDVTDCKIP